MRRIPLPDNRHDSKLSRSRASANPGRFTFDGVDVVAVAAPDTRSSAVIANVASLALPPNPLSLGSTSTLVVAGTPVVTRRIRPSSAATHCQFGAQNTDVKP